MPTTRPERDQRELLWLRNSFLVSFFPCTPSSANVPGSATTQSTETRRRSHPRPRTTSWAVARDSDSETWRRSIHHQFRHDACRGGSAASCGCGGGCFPNPRRSRWNSCCSNRPSWRFRRHKAASGFVRPRDGWGRLKASYQFPRTRYRSFFVLYYRD